MLNLRDVTNDLNIHDSLNINNWLKQVNSTMNLELVEPFSKIESISEQLIDQF